ncbi:MAG TPA: hypothetical protein PKC99_12600 [Anaerolineales bacterium]|nr:hypothetical protein [Anaerolineales bacterium]
MDYKKIHEELFSEWMEDEDFPEDLSFPAWLEMKLAELRSANLSPSSAETDALPGHADNCVLRSGGYACTCKEG